MSLDVKKCAMTELTNKVQQKLDKRNQIQDERYLKLFKDDVEHRMKINTNVKKLAQKKATEKEIKDEEKQKSRMEQQHRLASINKEAEERKKTVQKKWARICSTGNNTF